MKKLPDYGGWDLHKKPVVVAPAGAAEAATASLTGLLERVAAENLPLVTQNSEGPVAFGGAQAEQAKLRALVILIGVS